MLEYAAEIWRGRRDYQEDSFCILDLATRGEPPRATLYIVADGMGGHAGGAIASSAVINAFLAAYLSHSGRRTQALRAGVEAATAALADCEDSDDQLRGLGSTLIAVVHTDDGIEWISIGDSPLWILRKGTLHRVNADHSMKPVLERMAASGEISREEARLDPQRHQLRSALTRQPPELVDASEQPTPIQPGDLVLLASDGILTLQESEILSCCAKARTSTEACSALMDAVKAKATPSQDNTTIVAFASREPITMTEAQSPQSRAVPPPVAAAGPRREPSAAPPAPTVASPAKPLLMGAAGLAVVALAGWLLWPSTPPAPSPGTVAGASSPVDRIASPPPPPPAASVPPAPLAPEAAGLAESRPGTETGSGLLSDRDPSGRPGGSDAPRDSPLADGFDRQQAPSAARPKPIPLPDAAPEPVDEAVEEAEPAPFEPAEPANAPQDKPPAATAPPAPQTATLTVESSPGGATVFLDRTRTGSTGTPQELAPGTYMVTVEKDGYVNPRSRSVKLEAGKSSRLHFQLCRSSASSRCVDGVPWFVDGCGEDQAAKRICERDQTCVDGECVEKPKPVCRPRVSKKCEKGSLYYVDSCGVLESLPSGPCPTPPSPKAPAATPPTKPAVDPPTGDPAPGTTPPATTKAPTVKPPAPEKDCGSPRHHKVCHKGDIWWANACDKPVVVADPCPGSSRCRPSSTNPACR